MENLIETIKEQERCIFEYTKELANLETKIIVIKKENDRISTKSSNLKSIILKLKAKNNELKDKIKMGEKNKININYFEYIFEFISKDLKDLINIFKINLFLDMNTSNKNNWNIDNIIKYFNKSNLSNITNYIKSIQFNIDDLKDNINVYKDKILKLENKFNIIKIDKMIQCEEIKERQPRISEISQINFEGFHNNIGDSKINFDMFELNVKKRKSLNYNKLLKKYFDKINVILNENLNNTEITNICIDYIHDIIKENNINTNINFEKIKNLSNNNKERLNYFSTNFDEKNNISFNMQYQEIMYKKKLINNLENWSNTSHNIDDKSKELRNDLTLNDLNNDMNIINNLQKKNFNSEEKYFELNSKYKLMLKKKNELEMEIQINNENNFNIQLKLDKISKEVNELSKSNIQIDLDKNNLMKSLNERNTLIKQKKEYFQDNIDKNKNIKNILNLLNKFVNICNDFEKEFDEYSNINTSYKNLKQIYRNINMEFEEINDLNDIKKKEILKLESKIESKKEMKKDLLNEKIKLKSKYELFKKEFYKINENTQFKIEKLGIPEIFDDLKNSFVEANESIFNEVDSQIKTSRYNNDFNINFSKPLTDRDNNNDKINLFKNLKKGSNEDIDKDISFKIDRQKNSSLFLNFNKDFKSLLELINNISEYLIDIISIVLKSNNKIFNNIFQDNSIKTSLNEIYNEYKFESLEKYKILNKIFTDFKSKKLNINLLIEYTKIIKNIFAKELEVNNLYYENINEIIF